MSVNKVILIGRLGSEPEKRFSSSGGAITTLSVATSERYKDQSGEQKEVTEWHRVVYFGRIAEIVEQYASKGTQVYVEGRIRTREYTDKQGIKRYQTEIIGDVFRLLDRVDKSRQGDTNDYARAKGTRDFLTGAPQVRAPDVEGDDIPF